MWVPRKTIPMKSRMEAARSLLYMRNRLVSALLVAGTSVATYTGVAAVDSTPVYAQGSQQWTQAPYPGLPYGCAVQIAVSGTNVPWVLGCTGPDSGEEWVYVLNFTPCGSNCFGGTYSWVNTGIAGVSLSVDEYDLPWVLTKEGHIWSLLPSSSANAYGWTDFTTENESSAFRGGRLSGLAAMDTPDGFILFGLAYPNSGGDNTVYYAIMAGTAEPSFTGLWDGSGWGAYNVAGTKIVMFTGPSYQTPFVLKANGTLLSYVASTNSFTTASGGSITDLTDHYCIANNGGNIGLFAWGDAEQGWYNLGAPETPNGTFIYRVAYAAVGLAENGTVAGPSQLWGIDTSGDVFSNSLETLPE
jgi:hypothetical protein